MLIVYIITTTILHHKHISFIHPSVPQSILAIGVCYLISKVTNGKSLASNAITNEFIYQYLLPVIVLAEGFNLRKRVFNEYPREIFWLSIVIPIVIVAINSYLLITLQKVMVNTFHYDETYLMKNEILISFAITMSQVELHGATGPLVTIKNYRLFQIIFNSSMFNNNMCLVIVMTFERLIHQNDFSSDQIFSSFFKVGFFSIFLGLGVGSHLS